MASRAKRFYLCNLIPLWDIDESDMEVDWATGGGAVGELVEMRVDILRRKVRVAGTDGVTVDPDLKIRFEIYESDFLLSGGLNDRMAVISSHADFGDNVTVRPLRMATDVEAQAERPHEDAIILQWVPGVGDTPDTLKVRCWWRVADDNDVSGDPEFFFDVMVEGKLEDGKDLELEERSDHELKGVHWNVTDRMRKGRVTPIVDGEYVFLRMLQLMDTAEFSIHLAAWSLERSTPLVTLWPFQADYFQIPGMDPATYEALVARNRPLVQAVAGVDPDLVFYTASNGNVCIIKKTAPDAVAPLVQWTDEDTSLRSLTGIQVLSATVDDFRALLVDAEASRFYLLANPRVGDLKEAGRDGFLLRLGRRDNHEIVVLFSPLEWQQTLFSIQLAVEDARARGMSDPDIQKAVQDIRVRGLVHLAGTQGDAGLGYGDSLVDESKELLPPSGGTPGVRYYPPTGRMNRPTGVVIVSGGAPTNVIPDQVFITDTGNNCIRRFNWATLSLMTLAGQPVPGLLDGVGTKAQFNGPTGIAWDSKQLRVLVADTGNRKLRAIDPKSGKTETLAVKSIDGVAAATLGSLTGLAFREDLGAKGTLYVSERDRNRVLALDLDTMLAVTACGPQDGTAGFQDGAAAAARFRAPLDLSYTAGALHIADSENHVARMLDTVTGTVSTFGHQDKAGAEDLPIMLYDVFQRKAKAGVDIRILLDGASQGQAAVENAARLCGYHPRIQAFVQQHVQSINRDDAKGKSKPQGLASFHDKMLIVDGRSGFTGGVDFGPQKNNGLDHERFYTGGMFWHDISALVEGKATLGLEEHFVRRWTLLHDELTEQDRTNPPNEYRDQVPAIDTVACFKLPLRHYARTLLELDASCSKATAFQDVAEYRWEIQQEFQWQQLVRVEKNGVIVYDEEERTRRIPFLSFSVKEPVVELPRPLEAGQYRIKLTVRSSGGGEDTVERTLDVLPAIPDTITAVDRTDAAIADHDAESVRTWDPSPILINLSESEVAEILESYRRAILTARHYVYLEHQYIFYPEIGEFLEQAMKDNPQLNVLWTIPFFTEETQDPYAEKRVLEARGNFLSSTPQMLSLGSALNSVFGLGKSGLAQSQLKSQLAWHGFFRQHEMIEKLRAVDAKRVGVFSMRRLVPWDPDGFKMIYPHSKMMLCDDRFFSVGSANANGRGFVKDSENNVSAVSRTQARAFRERLWGEHLARYGVALKNSLDEIVPLAGHHLEEHSQVRIWHPAVGDIEREVTFVNPATGGVKVSGVLPPLDGRILWKDQSIVTMPLANTLDFWRSSVHSLAEYRKVQGYHASTNSEGELLIPGHEAKVGFPLFLGGRIVKLDQEGFAPDLNGLVLPPIGGVLKVREVSGDVIKLEWPGTQVVSRLDHDPITRAQRRNWATNLTLNQTLEIAPFTVKVVKANSDRIQIEFRLLPNQKGVAFDYSTPWILSKPPAERNRRTWEIDPPEGVEYAGPFSFLRYFISPFTDLDPDEHARLNQLGRDIAFA